MIGKRLGESVLFGEADEETGRRPARTWNVRGRYLPSWRVRSGVIRGLLAVVGVVVQFVGHDSAPTESGGFWHDVGLLLLLLAVSHPLWRRSHLQDFEARSRLETVGRTMKRVGVLCLFAAVLSLLTYRCLMIGGNSSAAGTVAVVGQLFLIPAVVSLMVGLVATVRVRRRRTPAMSREHRTERLLEWLVESERIAANQPASTRGRGGGTVPDRFARNPLSEFDPNRGASGRPAPIREFDGGTGPDRHARKVIRAWRTKIGWDSEKLTVTPHRNRPALHFPVVPRSQEDLAPAGPRPWAVAEMAVFTACCPSNGRRDSFTRVDSLLLLDDEGYCLYAEAGFMPEWSETVELARLAGVPCSAYSINCEPFQIERIRKLMFPPREEDQGEGESV